MDSGLIVILVILVAMLAVGIKLLHVAAQIKDFFQQLLLCFVMVIKVPLVQIMPQVFSALSTGDSNIEYVAIFSFFPGIFKIDQKQEESRG